MTTRTAVLIWRGVTTAGTHDCNAENCRTVPQNSLGPSSDVSPVHRSNRIRSVFHGNTPRHLHSLTSKGGIDEAPTTARGKHCQILRSISQVGARATCSTRAQARGWNSVNGISVGNACAKVLSARPQIYDNELASKEVENAAEDHRHECAAHDNDVVRHAEVRRRQIDKEGGGVHPSAARIE